MRSAINLVLLCCCAATALAREEYRKDFNRDVNLPPGRTLRIESEFGGITVHTRTGQQASIRATIRVSADTSAEARGLADRIQIEVTETGSGVGVRTIYPRGESRRNLSYGVDYDLTLPEAAPLDVRNRFGFVAITNLHAPVTVNNGNGAVRVSGARGRAEVQNSFGDVEVRNADGEVVVRNNNGTVTAGDLTGSADITNRFGPVRVTNAGKGVTIHSNNGNIEVMGAGGLVNITNSFGRVVVADAKGDLSVQNQNGEIQATGVAGAANLHNTFSPVRVSRIGKGLTVRSNNANVTADVVGGPAIVETSFGSVDLRDLKAGARVTAGNSAVRLSGVAGEVYAKTSFNGITLSDIGGPVTVESGNGSVTVDARPGPKCQPMSLHTSFAPIRVTLPANQGYNLFAKTSFGRIHTDFEVAVSGEIGADMLNGKIGGGGCELRVTGQNGNIDILKK